MLRLSFFLSFGIFLSVISPAEAEISTRQSKLIAQLASSAQIDNLEIDYDVTEVYGEDGYQVELDISAVDDIEKWQGSISLPENHQIVENYGVLISKGNNQVNFSGEEWNNVLSKGDKVTAIITIKGNPEEARLEFNNYSANLGVPNLSSFTEEDREKLKEEYAINELPETEATEKISSQDSSIANVQDSSSSASLPSSDFQEITEDGNETEPLEQSSQDGLFAYGEVVQKNFLFLEANRSGLLPANNRIEWRSDSTINDGADRGVDLTGGYFDAGDHIKFIQPMAFATTLLSWSGVDYRDAYQQSGQLEELLDAVKWSTDYLLKSHESNGTSTSRLWVQVGDETDHNYWVPPEQISNSRPSFAIDAENPGSDVAAGTASAFASASMLFAGIDDAYSTELLQNAIALYDFAETYLGKYSDSVDAVNPFYTSWSGYEDELVEGAIWLYRATGDTNYLTKAEEYFKKGIGHAGTYTYATDDHSYAALALLAKESSDPFFKEEFNSWARNWLDGTGGVNYTAGGLAVRAEEWGSAPLALSAAYLAEWYNDFVEPNSEYSSFAQQQLDYILGRNPLNYSYVIGFGDQYPLRPHHRGSAGSAPLDSSDRINDHLLVGALVGGPRNTDDSHQDRRNDWITNEVGVPYNAPLAASAVQQYENYGGEALPDTELAAIEGINDNTTSDIMVSETVDNPDNNAVLPENGENETEQGLETTDNSSDSPALSENEPNKAETGSVPATIEPSPGSEEIIQESEPAASLPTPTPGEGAIAAGFEGANGTQYNASADFDVAWSHQFDEFASISSDEAHSGNTSLKVAYPPDKQSNLGAKWGIPPAKEYYMSYWVKFDENFDFDGNKYSGGKLPGLGAGDLASGGDKPNGSNGFTSRYMWREDGRAVLYLYHMDQPGTYGEDIDLGTNFERGKWHKLTQRVRVNDNGQANGEVDVWMDDRQVLSRDGLRFTNGQEIDTAYFSTFHGGNGSDWWPSSNVNAYFDDFVVSTDPADVGL
jgi:endoglucanase